MSFRKIIIFLTFEEILRGWHLYSLVAISKKELTNSPTFCFSSAQNAYNPGKCRNPKFEKNIGNQKVRKAILGQEVKPISLYVEKAFFLFCYEENQSFWAKLKEEKHFLKRAGFWTLTVGWIFPPSSFEGRELGKLPCALTKKVGGWMKFNLRLLLQEKKPSCAFPSPLYAFLLGWTFFFRSRVWIVREKRRRGVIIRENYVLVGSQTK